MTANLKQDSPNPNLYKYVWICLGCLFLIVASFPIAYWRVSQEQKDYQGSPFRSLNWDDVQKGTLHYPD